MLWCSCYGGPFDPVELFVRAVEGREVDWNAYTSDQTPQELLCGSH